MIIEPRIHYAPGSNGQIAYAWHGDGPRRVGRRVARVGVQPPTGRQFEISCGDQRAWIVEVGGGLRL